MRSRTRLWISKSTEGANASTSLVACLIRPAEVTLIPLLSTLQHQPQRIQAGGVRGGFDLGCAFPHLLSERSVLALCFVLYLSLLGGVHVCLFGGELLG